LVDFEEMGPNSITTEGVILTGAGSTSTGTGTSKFNNY